MGPELRPSLMIDLRCSSVEASAGIHSPLCPAAQDVGTDRRIVVAATIRILPRCKLRDMKKQASDQSFHDRRYQERKRAEAAKKAVAKKVVREEAGREGSAAKQE